MRAPRALALAGVLALAGSTACTSAAPQSFEGRHIEEVMAELGPATRIVPYPYGGSVYIWESRFRQTPRISHLLPADGTPLPQEVVVDRMALLVNDAGLVTASVHDEVNGR